MKAEFLISMAALLSLTTVAACSQVTPSSSVVASAPPAAVKKDFASGSQTVPGSYIVKAPGDGATAIRKHFAQYGVKQVNPIGNEQYEIRLEHDPGLDALKSSVVGSNGAVTTIQPNFVYRAF